MRLQRSTRVAASIWVLACLSSCSSDDDTPTPTGPDSTAPTVVGIEVSGAASLHVGQEATYLATARLSTGGTRPVTGGTWGTDASSIVSIDNSGRVSALATGPATIWVDAEGRRGTLLVTVKGRLVGDWVLFSTNRPSNPSGVGIAIKSFTETEWLFTQKDPVTGVVVFRHGGRYTLSGSEYIELVDFANPSTAHLVGQTFIFEVTFDGDTHRQVGFCCGGGGRGGGTGPNVLLDSVWKRVSTPAGVR